MHCRTGDFTLFDIYLYEILGSICGILPFPLTGETGKYFFRLFSRTQNQQEVFVVLLLFSI